MALEKEQFQNCLSGTLVEPVRCRVLGIKHDTDAFRRNRLARELSQSPYVEKTSTYVFVLGEILETHERLFARQDAAMVLDAIAAQCMRDKNFECVSQVKSELEKGLKALDAYDLDHWKEDQVALLEKKCPRRNVSQSQDRINFEYNKDLIEREYQTKLKSLPEIKQNIQEYLRRVKAYPLT